MLTSNNSYDWPCCVTKLNGKLILQGVSSRIGNQTDVLPAEMCRSLPERMLTKSNMATVDSSIVFDIYTTPPCAHFLMKHHSKLLFIGFYLYILRHGSTWRGVLTMYGLSQSRPLLKIERMLHKAQNQKLCCTWQQGNWDYHKIDNEGWQTCVNRIELKTISIML